MTTLNTALVEGALYVKSIHGRFGRFNVGKLVCPFGEFCIKDKIIDQYEEGAYEGAFELGKVWSAERRIAGGGFIIELRARLDDVTLFDEASLPDDAAVGVSETDPIEEDEDVSDAGARDASGLSRAELFGPLWPLGETVKLDAAVDRAVFRRQRDVLKQLDYQFQPKDQIWRLIAE